MRPERGEARPKSGLSGRTRAPFPGRDREATIAPEDQAEQLIAFVEACMVQLGDVAYTMPLWQREWLKRWWLKESA